MIFIMRIALLFTIGMLLGAAPAESKPKPPEWLEMFTSIVQGGDMGPGTGWFHDGQGRFGWEWLARKCDINGDEQITAKEFPGSPEAFRKLDRDGDGRITKEDLDWADNSPYMQQYFFARQLLRRGDTNRDNKLSEEEWLKLFRSASGSDPELDAEKLRRLLYPPRPPMPSSSGANSGEPSMWTLLKGLYRCEIGSVCAGPGIDELAPNFRLSTHDGKQTLELKQFRNQKPVVLVFGNFTCGPFRNSVGAVEALKKKYGEQFEFIAIYVREAHPTDGWRMVSNDRDGVIVAQPLNNAEKVKLATECTTRLKLTMPLLVDDISDRVGNLYSGMPERLYLIDTEGRIVYKSGRGPFGFKVGELEQSMLMLQLDEKPASKSKTALPIPSTSAFQLPLERENVFGK